MQLAPTQELPCALRNLKPLLQHGVSAEMIASPWYLTLKPSAGSCRNQWLRKLFTSCQLGPYCNLPSRRPLQHWFFQVCQQIKTG
eukprot:6467519-Amphidinium_carterae.1